MAGGFYSRAGIEEIVRHDLMLPVERAGKVFHVDIAYGSDARDGETWVSALKTITAAIAKCVNYRGDVIKVRCQGGTVADYHGNNEPIITETITLNKHGVSLIGVPATNFGLLPRWVPVQPQSAPTIKVTADYCEIAGFRLSADSVVGNGGQCIQLLRQADPIMGGNYSWIHHNQFEWYTAEAYALNWPRAGIELVGSPFEVTIEDNLFGFLSNGILEGATPIASSFRVKIRRNHFYELLVYCIDIKSNVAMIGPDNVFALDIAGVGAGWVSTRGGTAGYNMVFGNFFPCNVNDGGLWDSENCHGLGAPATDIWCGNLTMVGHNIDNPA